MKGLLLPAAACLILVMPMQAQFGPLAGSNATQLFHPTGPMPSYEVATIKKPEPETGNLGGPGMVMRMTGRNGQTIKNYILNAYGASSVSQGQVVGGPAWIGTEAYVIQGKPSDELRDEMSKMKPAEQLNQNRMMQQSLLADRFKLKAHFETREMPLYELVAAKGGLKMKAVAAPPPFAPGGPPPPTPGGPMPPGMIRMMMGKGGERTLDARATTMQTLISMLRNEGEIGGRPIVDKTGFAGNFDVVALKWAGMTGDASVGDADSPSLFTALEENLGLKLIATKGPVEVLVIDSIERPSEN